ncbi:aspartate--tRNA(Asn) ligase [Planosporangium sp. 12N6]|uniref:aspartate--tRNA(Asn) ligase n=1 Tax=Planosporangium spinosum TaxID=3402278 RepID=UPI003CF04675
MQRILSTELSAHAGAEVTLAGWVHRRRLLRTVAFLILRDRAGLAQVVVTDPDTRARLEKLPEETAVSVTATVVANADAPGGFELADPTVTALSPGAEPVPVDLFRPRLSASLPVTLDAAPVTLRHPARRAAARLAAAAAGGFRSVLDGLGFTEVHTPKLVAAATESGANLFEVDYFGRPAYLAQSPQFYKQTLVGVFERVYEVGPVFRAEPHDTARHLAQYTSLDAELGFVRDHRDVMAVLRDVINAMVDAVAARPAEVALSAADVPSVPETIPEIHFAEALALVVAPDDEPDLAPAHERALGEWAVAEHGSDFLFVTGYPMRKRPFYTHPSPDPAYSNSFDLLFRGVELVTGGQRLHRYDDYVAALAGQPLEPYRWYLDAFRFGMPPHGGFAIGLERFVARLVGAANVREVTLFPRDLHRLTP